MTSYQSTQIADDTILIRPFRDEDIHPLYEAVRESITELSRWLPWCHANYRIEETTEFIRSREAAWQNDTDYGFGVFETGTGKFLGGVGLSQINRTYQMGNLGYWVRTSSAGRGVTPRSARLAARFALEELKLQRVEILAAVGNRASQRVAEKVGAIREGTLRRRLLVNNQPQDAILYSLVSEDFKSKDEG